MTAEAVAAHLAARGEWAYSRSSGPGGQRRDHAETRAELTLRPEHAEGLPAGVARRVRAGLGLEHRALRLRAGTERSRERNRAIVMARLERRVAVALAPPPAPRRPTAPSRGARVRRLDAKSRRGALKRSRAVPTAE